jgi:hypothetical protein
MLTVLIKTTMEVPNMGNAIDDDFTIDNNFKSQHTMGRWMLGTHVDDHLFRTNGLAGRRLDMTLFHSIIRR